MTKRELIDDQNSCLNRAEEDEPVFVLLGRDTAAARAILDWVNERVSLGLNKIGDTKMDNAIEVARQMRAYRDTHN